ncbi:hypothetical protein [Pseudobythopirellula maris]|uniref:hypothetical protein n=1 Tax=Pseudobythopirellula maris TaxID=2527991 RepID=UPI0011B58219|nr:hypothetical protein [Pseudobythopirellula maris]
MHDKDVLLSPLALLHSNGLRNSGLKAMAELQLLMAIRDRSDLLLFRRDTHDQFLCNTFVRMNDGLVGCVPFPLYFSGIIVNHYRSIFRTEYPEQSSVSRVTLDGKNGCSIRCAVLGASPEGLAQIEIGEGDIPGSDCSDVINEYYRQRRQQKPLVRRLHDNLRGWVTGYRLQPYVR